MYFSVILDRNKWQKIKHRFILHNYFSSSLLLLSPQNITDALIKKKSKHIHKNKNGFATVFPFRSTRLHPVTPFQKKLSNDFLAVKLEFSKNHLLKDLCRVIRVLGVVHCHFKAPSSMTHGRLRCITQLH